MISFPSKITFKVSDFCFVGLDLNHRTRELGFPSCAVEKDDCVVSQGKQIRSKNMESIKADVLKRKQPYVAFSVGIVVL